MPVGWLGNGALVWILLIGAGIAVLVNEVRRARNRRS